VDTFVRDEAERKDLLAQCEGRVVEITDRQSCDVELISNGAFSPIEGFMNEDVYDGVVENMRIPGSNLLFGLPITFDTDRTDLSVGQKVQLNYKGSPMAVLDVESRWKPDKAKEALKCYLTSALEHPGVQNLSMDRGRYYLGGRVHGFEIPERVFPCQTPAEVRESLPADVDVVAFQCRNPVHRAHYELFARSLYAPNVGEDAVVLVHPTCGPTQGDDIPGDVRYHTYEVLKKELNNDRIRWAYLPYSMILAGPREAIMHMMIRKNYGCTHFIIGRDMAGSKSTVTQEDFYGAYDAQEFAIKHSEELGVKTVPSLNLVYTEEEGYVEAEKATGKPLKLSGTKFRQMLRAGKDIPEWFAFKSVVSVLREHTKIQPE
jgi:sulfate adenylyltransferase